MKSRGMVKKFGKHCWISNWVKVFRFRCRCWGAIYPNIYPIISFRPWTRRKRQIACGTACLSNQPTPTSALRPTSGHHPCRTTCRATHWEHRRVRCDEKNLHLHLTSSCWPLDVFLSKSWVREERQTELGIEFSTWAGRTHQKIHILPTILLIFLKKQ